MSVPLLKDPDIFPSSDELKKALNEKYTVLEEFLCTVESEEFDLVPTWRFYKDGHAWLCKISLKKKTVIWLSLWSDCFKVAFYFTEKSGAGIPGLEVDDSLKEFYEHQKPVGKLKPLVVEVREKSQLADIYTLIRYKNSQL